MQACWRLRESRAGGSRGVTQVSSDRHLGLKAQLTPTENENLN